MKGKKSQRKGNNASSWSKTPTRRLVAGKAKSAGQPAAGSKPKSAASHKFFNGLYAFLVIVGMITSALGLRTRVKQSNVTPVAQAQTSEAAIDWTLEGGSAGGCREVRVWPDGLASSGGCTDRVDDQTVRFSLRQDEASQLRNWIGKFQSFSIDLNPSGASSNDRVHLAFRGSGSRSATPLDEQAIESFVENLVQTGG